MEIIPKDETFKEGFWKKDKTPPPKIFDPNAPEAPEAIKNLASHLQGFVPLLDSFGLDLDWRRQFAMKAGLQAAKGKFDLNNLFQMPQERKKTGFQRFWLGLKEGIPVIMFIWALTVITILLFKILHV